MKSEIPYEIKEGCEAELNEMLAEDWEVVE